MKHEMRHCLDAAGISDRDTLIVGCSGGPDSTALLYLLTDLQPEYGYSLRCAMYEHLLRSRLETASELYRVRSHCDRLGIPLDIGRSKAGRIARTAHLLDIGTEAAARIERYEFLRGIQDAHDGSYIVLGHNCGDVHETIVQRFFQGSGPEGLTGIPEVREKLLRPLVHASRTEIMAYLEDHDIDYCTDSSNLTTEFVRNALRLELLPRIEKIFPGYGTSLDTFAEKMLITHEYLEQASKQEIPMRVHAQGRGVSIPVSVYNAASPILRLYALLRAMKRISGDSEAPLRVPFKALRPLIYREHQATGEKRTLLRTREIEIITTGKAIHVMPHVVFDNEKSYLMVVRADEMNGLSLDCADFTLNVSMADSRSQAVSVPVESYPVLIRSRRPGDTITRRDKCFTIKELLATTVEARFRWCVPVVQDRRRIIAVIGRPFGGDNWVDDHVTANTSEYRDVLKLNIDVKVES